LNGHSKVGTIDIVFAQVERIHIDESFLTPDGKLDILRIRPLARLGYYDYTSITDIFEMRIPNASAAEANGLEGTST
jgi:flavin reductase (DIM6/NTAB) family NADH-FMN oxidoreductase RutF